jgi:hypothetical protein
MNQPAKDLSFDTKKKSKQPVKMATQLLFWQT